MPENVEGRALWIAAKVMVEAGICRHDSINQCRRTYVDVDTCTKCLRSWCLSKARQELRCQTGGS